MTENRVEIKDTLVCCPKCNGIGRILENKAATPAVGGLAEATIELNGLLDKYWMGDNSKTNIIAMCAAQQKCKDALATQPASQPAVGGERKALADRFEAVHYRPDMFGDDDKIGGPSLTLAERDFIVGLLRAQAASPLRQSLASEIAIAGHLRIENGRLLSQTEKSLVVSALRVQPASASRERLVEQLTEWFDCLDFDRSHEATRQAEYSELMRIVASALPPEQPAADPTILAHCDELHDLGFAAGWDAAKEACASYLSVTTESKRFADELMTAQSLQHPQKETK